MKTEEANKLKQEQDLLKKIEEEFPKINVDDGLGKAVELLVQYGVPYGIALNTASKLSKVKELDSTVFALFTSFTSV